LRGKNVEEDAPPTQSAVAQPVLKQACGFCMCCDVHGNRMANRNAEIFSLESQLKNLRAELNESQRLLDKAKELYQEPNSQSPASVKFPRRRRGESESGPRRNWKTLPSWRSQVRKPSLQAKPSSQNQWPRLLPMERQGSDCKALWPCALACDFTSPKTPITHYRL